MMDWQFWTGLAGLAFGFAGIITTIIACVWKLRGWAEEQFNATRENAHKILEKHEEKDEQRHRENVERLDQLERESTRRMNALEVQMARINRGGKHSGPDYVAS
jgi:hypothetical protein